MKTRTKIFMAVLLTALTMLFAFPAMAGDPSSSNIYTVMVSDGYLALRNDTAFSASNEIGKLYTGDTVTLISSSSNPTYWYVYAPTLGKNGYVNKNYLYHMGESFTMTVKVSSGYLALRNAKAYDSANEIGKLYTGDTVQVLDHSGSTYWYVYSSKLMKSGYVNKDYLEGTVPSSAGTPSGSSSGGSASAPSSYTEYTVKVNDGYLALRNAQAFDYNNEIGKLYTGDSFYVTTAGSGQYWYGYSPKLKKYGYVNRDYLQGAGSSSPSYSTPRTVKVSDGYLALRNAQAFDYNNEIGKLYTGDTVYVQSAGSGQYWYVYSPTLGKYGYVNKDYLY